MNRYTVSWMPEPRHALAQLWLEADDRNAIADAANRIDRLLSANPQTEGTPLHEGFFSLNVFPLRVIYGIRESDRAVEIERVSLVVYP